MNISITEKDAALIKAIAAKRKAPGANVYTAEPFFYCIRDYIEIQGEGGKYDFCVWLEPDCEGHGAFEDYREEIEEYKKDNPDVPNDDSYILEEMGYSQVDLTYHPRYRGFFLTAEEARAYLQGKRHDFNFDVPEELRPRIYVKRSDSSEFERVINFMYSIGEKL
ncbi:MAG: hypothetical protein GY757_10015 [bacterium]|nr:hypothetical protein [bacterium]